MPISSLFLLPKTAALEKVQLMKRLLSQLHWILTTAFLLALFPLFRRAALPLSIDLREIGGGYWLGKGVKGGFFVVVLFLVFFSLAGAGGAPGARVFVGTSVLGGGSVVFSFQHGVAGLKFAGEYDPFFEHLDRVIFHASVSQISHAALLRLPNWSAHALEFAYFSLFMQMGAALIISALAGSRRHGLQYVATLLVGYYIAIAVFFFWPTLGPFSVCPDHLSPYPPSPPTFLVQQT